MMTALHTTLKSVKDIPHLLKKFSCSSSLSTLDDWSSLSKSICSILRIRKIFEVGISERQHEHDGILNLNIVKKAFISITNELIYIYNLVNGVINFSQSNGKRQGTIIAFGICEELDELRMIYEDLPDFLDQVSSLELRRLPCKDSNAIRGSIVYMPQIGYLMCIFGAKLDECVLENLRDFEFAFAGGEGHEEDFFYRTSKTKELDLALGDIYHKILDMERAILMDLELRIQPFFTYLHKAAGFLAELDCMLSLALVAHQHKYVRPLLTEEDTLEIKNGRHVLQEMTVETFVPNDTSFTDERRISVITGPNYSGKSIYIKQVLACTHLSEVFNENYLPQSKSLGFYTMSILKSGNNIKKGMEDIIFLYRLVPGHAFSSYGLHCAELAGVPHEILERASYVLHMTNDGKPIDRFCNESLSAKDQQYKDLVEKLVSFDFMNGDVETFLKDIFSWKLQIDK